MTDRSVQVEIVNLASVCSLVVSKCQLLEGADLLKDLTHPTQKLGMYTHHLYTEKCMCCIFMTVLNDAVYPVCFSLS